MENLEKITVHEENPEDGEYLKHWFIMSSHMVDEWIELKKKEWHSKSLLFEVIKREKYEV